MASTASPPYPFRVLIAHRGGAAATTLKRVFAIGERAAITYAPTGIDAARHLSNETYDLILVDLQLPELSGVRLLELLRQSPTYEGVPVFAVTAVPHGIETQQALQLGIADTFIEPLDANVVRRRIRAHLVEQRRTALAEEPRGEVVEPRTVIIADGDGRFRRAFLDAFHPMLQILEAESGADALALATIVRPAAVFVGHDLGLLRSDALAREIKNHRDLAETKVIAVAHDTALARVRTTAPYDGGLARTINPLVLREQVQRLLGGLGDHQPPSLEAALRQDLAQSMEQLCRLWLHQGMAVSAVAPPVLEVDVLASTVLTPSDSTGAFTLTLATNLAGGFQVFREVLTRSPEKANEADLKLALVSAVGIVARRLQVAIARHGLRADYLPPVAARVREWVPAGPRPDVYARSESPEAFLVARLATPPSEPLPGHPDDPSTFLQSA